MRWIISFLFICCGLHADENSLDIKKNISQKLATLEKTPSGEERSRLYYGLALDYFYDQEKDLAFHYFLQALEEAPKYSATELKEEERTLYSQALQDYLSRLTSDPVVLARELVEKYGQKAKENPHFIHLNFLLATAYANLSEYEDFFEKFYNGFSYLSDSFLAFKTQGILYLRLAHHGTSCEKREAFQNKAAYFLTEALTRNPHDPSLYKVLVFLAKEEKNSALLISYLKKILDHQVHFLRSDILFYVREAVALGEWEMGQGIIDHAHVLYEYSRAVGVAQEFLNQHKSGQLILK